MFFLNAAERSTSHGGRNKIDSSNCVELYNLKDDISEQNNLASVNKAKRDELLDELLAWVKTTDAPIPTEINPDYDKDAPAGPDAFQRRKKASK